MRDVPRRFRPELPSPFPGRDQSSWGYPITLQLGPRRDAGTPIVAMTLREAGPEGPVVPGLLSTPQQPGNPLLVPARTWCLIPEQHLKPNATYHVRAELQGAELGLGGHEMTWSFTTGR
jgi:hypothetical protein